MARSAPIFDHGYIDQPDAASKLYAKFLAKITEVESNSTQAWEQVWTDGDDARVFHSVGDRNLGSGNNVGDSDIWLWTDLDATKIKSNVFQDFSPSDGYSTGVYHPAYTLGGWQSLVIDGSAAVEWWSIMSPHFIIFVWRQAGNNALVWAGQVIRPYADSINGIARITSQSGTGNGVTIGLDRDISANIQVGQKVWLVNQTPDSTSIQSVGIDVVTVTAISASQATVDGVTNTYAVGSWFGLDPLPVYLGDDYTSACYSTHNKDATYSANPQAVFGNPGVSAIQESHYKPSQLDGAYWAFQPYVYHMGGNCDGFRGKIPNVRLFTWGLQSDGDVMRMDYDEDQQWVVFLEAWFYGVTGDYCCGFGPGADLL